MRPPNIDKVYSFDDVPSAYNHCSSQDVRGKIVVNVDDDGDAKDEPKSAPGPMDGPMPYPL